MRPSPLSGSPKPQAWATGYLKGLAPVPLSGSLKPLQHKKQQHFF
ncbi:MAG: hypothetical protein Q4A62_08005 [Eikenella sp.]|nr:hypothetical protein [Eikenella sp.]